MARTSTPWRLLPTHELGCGSASAAWRRLNEWAEAGVFDQLHLDVLDSAANRAGLRRPGITARIARRGVESSARLGR